MSAGIQCSLLEVNEPYLQLLDLILMLESPFDSGDSGLLVLEG